MGINTGQCTILGALVRVGVGWGGILGQQKDKKILTIPYELLVPVEREGRRGGINGL